MSNQSTIARLEERVKELEEEIARLREALTNCENWTGLTFI